MTFWYAQRISTMRSKDSHTPPAITPKLPPHTRPHPPHRPHRILPPPRNPPPLPHPPQKSPQKSTSQATGATPPTRPGSTATQPAPPSPPPQSPPSAARTNQTQAPTASTPPSSHSAASALLYPQLYATLMSARLAESGDCKWAIGKVLEGCPRGGDNDTRDRTTYGLIRRGWWILSGEFRRGVEGGWGWVMYL